MRTNNTALTASLLLSLTAGCSLIKVNGKPLGGGPSSSSSTSSEPSAGEAATSTSSAAPPSESGPDDNPYAHCQGVGPQYQDCIENVNIKQRQQREAVLAKQPPWCKEYHLSASGSIDLDKFKNLTDPSRSLYSDAASFAAVMCMVEGRNYEQRPKVLELRPGWMKHHGLDEKDFLAAVAVATRYVPDDQKLTALGPAVAQLELHKAEQLDQLGTRVSMLGRVGFVERCGYTDKDNPIRNILCAREPIDMAKAFAEIDAAPGILPHMRLRLRQQVRKALAFQRSTNARLAELAKEEPAIGTLIAIADAQHKEWANPTPARAKAVKLLEQMEAAMDANKHSAFAGCEATTGAAWADVVRAAEIPAVSAEDTLRPILPVVFQNAEAYLARRAYELCMAGTGHRDATPYGVVGPAAYRRGPRTGTYAAWIAASDEIKFDHRDLSVQSAIAGRGAGSVHFESHALLGTIETVTPGKSSVTISFKTDIGVREDCIDWKQTGRISNITAGGAVEYESVCTKRGMVKYNKTPENITIDPVLAAGLKPGMFLMMTRRWPQQPMLATANAKSTKAVWLLGVPLK